MLTFLLVMLLAAAVLAFVLMPLLRAPAPVAGPDPQLVVARDRALLAKERKLAEIRELRGDVASGKLTAADGKVLERALRADAADLLHQLDAAESALVEVTPAPAAEAPAEPARADDADEAEARPATGQASTSLAEPLP